MPLTLCLLWHGRRRRAVVPARMAPQRTQFVTFVREDLCVALLKLRAAQTSDSTGRRAALIPAVPHDCSMLGESAVAACD